MSFYWNSELRLFGSNFDVEMFLKNCESSTTKVWRKGDSIGRSIRQRKENGCALGVAEGELPDLADVLDGRISQVIEWSDAAKPLGAKSQLSVVIRTNGESFPALSFGSHLLKALGASDVSLDIDIISSL